MPNTIISSESKTFSTVLWALDYMPVLSSGKAAADYFAKRCWNPENFDQLSPYAQAYFNHLAEKENSRYIAVIPFIGNAVVLVQDCYDSVLRQRELIAISSAEQGSLLALEHLYAGTSEQKAKALECSYKAALHPLAGNARSAHRFLFKIVCEEEGENKKKVVAWLLENIQKLQGIDHAEIYNKPKLPQELREKVIDLKVKETLEGTTPLSKYSLFGFLKNVSPQDKDKTIAFIMKAAESGNEKAFDYLQIEISLCPSKSFSFIFDWIVREVQTPSSPIYDSAWEYLNGKYFSNRKEQVLAAYFNLLQKPKLPKDRFSYILKTLDSSLLIGTPEEKNQILTGYLKVAEKGNPKIMFRVAKAYQDNQNQVAALGWFEKAARANHTSSVLEMARISMEKKDVSAAEFWLGKATGRCHSPLKLHRYRLVEQWIQSTKRSSSGDRPRAERNDYNTSSQRTQNGARQRTYTQQRPRSDEAQYRRPSISEAEANRIQAELTQIFGEFTTAAELQQKWRRWTLKAHPDRGGPIEEFKRVTDLFEAYKHYKGW